MTTTLLYLTMIILSGLPALVFTLRAAHRETTPAYNEPPTDPYRDGEILPCLTN